MYLSKLSLCFPFVRFHRTAPCCWSLTPALHANWISTRHRALQSFAQNSELALSADLERAEAQRNYSLRVALLGNKAALRIEGIAKPGVGPRAWRG